VPYSGLLKTYSVSSFFHHRSPDLQVDGVVRAERRKHAAMTGCFQQLIQNGNAQDKKCFLSQIEKCLRFPAPFAFLGWAHDYGVFGRFLPQHH